jgi:hypothetical protein
MDKEEKSKMILSLGDIHGRDKWINHTHDNFYDFKNWKISIENGAPVDDEFWSDLPYTKYDKIIFLGDYVDSFDLDNITILNNFKNILFLKKCLPDKVVLLLGNHDIQYFIDKQICSGYRAEMRPDLYDLFTNKEYDFKIAHLEKSSNGNRWLWTHAGVTHGWLEQVKKEVFNPDYRFFKILKHYKDSELDEFLNLLFDIRNDLIFNSDPYSGGLDLWAGPLWVRPLIFNKNPLVGVNQIVGHTPQIGLRKDKLEVANHYFVDCLWDDYDETLKVKIE